MCERERERERERLVTNEWWETQLVIYGTHII